MTEDATRPVPERLVVVTGATRGLGLAICAALLAAGFRVVGSGRAVSPAAEKLRAQSAGRFAFEPHDLANTEGLHAWTREVVARHGAPYGLVNNAALGLDGVLATMHESQIAQMLRVNVEAPMLLAKYFSRSMLLKRQGRIVNVSSIIASTGFSGLSVYAATKAALVGFSRSLARELGQVGVTVNCVAPGYMQTEMTEGLRDERLETIRRRSPLGRLATVDDAAAAVAYLMSDAAASVTGTTLTVDAGSTA